MVVLGSYAVGGHGRPTCNCSMRRLAGANKSLAGVDNQCRREQLGATVGNGLDLPARANRLKDVGMNA
jgi:hypothetical protein